MSDDFSASTLLRLALLLNVNKVVKLKNKQTNTLESAGYLRLSYWVEREGNLRRQIGNKYLGVCRLLGMRRPLEEALLR